MNGYLFFSCISRVSWFFRFLSREQLPFDILLTVDACQVCYRVVTMKRNGVRVTIGGLLLVGACVVGCRHDESEQHAAVPRRAANSSNVATDVVGQATKLSDRQQDVLQRIEAVGGLVECDRDGFPLLIDLADDRVFADDVLVRSLAEFPKLGRLRLAVTNTAPEALRVLESLHELVELFLQDAPIADQDLTRILAATPRLTHLTLRRLTRISDAIVPALVKSPHLRNLALIEMDGVSGAMLAGLKEMPSLRMLDLRGCGTLASDDFSNLLQLDELVDVKLGGPAINDDVLSMIAWHPRLVGLSIEDAEVSSECLQCLGEKGPLGQRLRSLMLARCFGVSDETLSALVHFPQLESLTLRNIFVTGSFIGPLRDAKTGSSSETPPSLTTLIVTNGFLTDESIVHLPEIFPRLRRLDLRGNNGITDESLAVIRQLVNLTELRLEETGVSQAGAARVKLRQLKD